MIWQDMLLDRWVDEAPLRETIAAAFGVLTNAVVVADTPEQFATIASTTRVILERDRQYRDFPLQILVVLRDDALATRFGHEQGVMQVAQTVAGQLGATVLFAEGPLSPSEWVRIRPTGEVDIVLLDVDDSGDVDSFFVVDEHARVNDQDEDAPSPSRLTA